MKRVGELSAEELREWREEGRDFVLLDVREQGEWDEGHIDGAVHIPVGSLDFYVPRLMEDKAKPVVVYCASGRRSYFACQELQKMGYEEIYNLSEGYLGYKGIL